MVNKIKITRAFERTVLAVTALLLLAPFQNCGHFQASDVALLSVAQCKSVYARRALARVDAVKDLDCASPDSYLCERRVFAPGISSQSKSAVECPAGDDFCVTVETRQFDTEDARAGADPAQFLPGGDYDHVEARCYHRWLYRGWTVLEADDRDVAAALGKVKTACANAREGAK